jgi:hypothetical protein
MTHSVSDEKFPMAPDGTTAGAEGDRVAGIVTTLITRHTETGGKNIDNLAL